MTTIKDIKNEFRTKGDMAREILRLRGASPPPTVQSIQHADELSIKVITEDKHGKQRERIASLSGDAAKAVGYVINNNFESGVALGAQHTSDYLLANIQTVINAAAHNQGIKELMKEANKIAILATAKKAPVILDLLEGIAGALSDNLIELGLVLDSAGVELDTPEFQEFTDYVKAYINAIKKARNSHDSDALLHLASEHDYNDVLLERLKETMAGNRQEELDWLVSNAADIIEREKRYKGVARVSWGNVVIPQLLKRLDQTPREPWHDYMRQRLVLAKHNKYERDNLRKTYDQAKIVRN